MTSDSCEFSLVPTAFTALTRKMYCSPGVRPCTTNLGGQGRRVARLHPVLPWRDRALEHPSNVLTGPKG